MNTDVVETLRELRRLLDRLSKADYDGREDIMTDLILDARKFMAVIDFILQEFQK